MLTCIRSYNAILFEMLWVKEYRNFFCKASECYYSSVRSDNCFFTLSNEVDPSDFFAFMQFTISIAAYMSSSKAFEKDLNSSIVNSSKATPLFIA